MALAREGSHFVAAEVAPGPGCGLVRHFGIHWRCSPKLATQDASWFQHAPGLTKIIQNHTPVWDVLKDDVGVHEVERTVDKHPQTRIRCDVYVGMRNILELVVSHM